MLVMPVVSANFKPITRCTNFCASAYTIGAEAEKVIREMVAVPRIETRGLLTSLLAFLRGDNFKIMTSNKTCHIDKILLSKPTPEFRIPTPIGGVQIQTIDFLTIEGRFMQDDSGNRSFTHLIEKDSKSRFIEYMASEFAQSDKQAAEELLRNVAKPV